MYLLGEDNYISSNIRRCNRNLLLVNGCILLMLIIIGFVTERYFYNFFFGPFNIDNGVLISINNPDSLQKYFYTVNGDAVYDTGVAYIIQHLDKYTNKVTSETVEAYYYRLVVNKKFLIVKSPAKRKKLFYSGALINIPDDIKSSIVKNDVEKKFLPFMLDAASFRTNGYWGLGVCIPVLLMVFWNLIKFIQRNNSPEDHPVCKKLANYGVPSDIASKIHEEILTQAVHTGYVVVTPSWLLVERYFRLDVEKLTDIMWVYKKITTHKAYGVITTGKHFEVYIMTRTGRNIFIMAKEKQINEIINNLCNKAPWVMAGFSMEIKVLWEKQRDVFISRVDQKRAELTNGKK